MYSKKSRLFTLALLTSLVSTVAMPLRSNAQLESAKEQVFPSTSLRRVNSAPGLGDLRHTALRPIPPSKIHILNGVVQPRAASDPVLYTTRYDLDGDGLNDLLWGFPTIGYDQTNNSAFVQLIAQTLQAAAPAALNNGASVYSGELGQPAQITRLVLRFGIFDLNHFTQGGKTGSVGIFVFDGIDFSAANKPAAAKLANDINGVGASYVVRRKVPTGSTTFAFDFDTAPIKITDPNGKFGILIAKVDDSGDPSDPTYVNTGTSFQALVPIGYASGPNLAWTLNNGDFTTLNLQTIGANSLFNQGEISDAGGGNVLDFPPLNFNFRVQGKKLDGTAASTGSIQGNLRRRGINPPVLPIGSAQNPESAPGFYQIDSFLTGTNTRVRTDFVYSQPSYDSKGNLNDGIHGSETPPTVPPNPPPAPVFPPNFRISGYPAGTYDFVIQQVPILFFPAMGSPLRDTLWDPTIYPFADYVPTVVTGVTVPGGGTATLTARLERLGDIDDGSATNTPDGLVEFADLTALAIAYNTMTGDALFNPAADLVGDPTNPMNPQGFPDGLVEFADLTALAIMYNTGAAEQP